ncbi:MAG: hypothetical protein JXA21_06420 [Anaerolineae bacterium]|nr:hypothetical protein [Anaerolineae bacterium]
MISANIAFEKMGVEQITGDKIVNAVNCFITKYPRKDINIQMVSDNSGCNRAIVKRILYILLGLRYLKATFVPIHNTCGRVIGQQERSISVINEKIENEEYFCIGCREIVYEAQEVQIKILFWEPGINVK